MAKKQFVDKDGRKFVEVTPWYKQWWSWVLAVAAIILMISLIGGSKDRSESKQISQAGLLLIIRLIRKRNL